MTDTTINVKNLTRFPTHIAIVPDGNGRWAEQRGLPRLGGHRAGADNMFRAVNYLKDYPVKFLTVYGFSTENWTRPEEEVTGLFKILEIAINQHTEEINRNGIRLVHIGRLPGLPQSLQNAIKKSMEKTKNNTGMTLAVAFNYGGRAEIVDATKRILADGITPDKVDEALLGKYLYTAGMPDVDLLIRSGDEFRLSNFLIWQAAYSEHYFTNILWPDFNKSEIDKALVAFSQRNRRFGGLPQKD